MATTEDARTVRGIWWLEAVGRWVAPLLAGVMLWWVAGLVGANERQALTAGFAAAMGWIHPSWRHIGFERWLRFAVYLVAGLALLEVL